jgi:hypothetical protein
MTGEAVGLCTQHGREARKQQQAKRRSQSSPAWANSMRPGSGQNRFHGAMLSCNASDSRERK